MAKKRKKHKPNRNVSEERLAIGITDLLRIREALKADVMRRKNSVYAYEHQIIIESHEEMIEKIENHFRKVVETDIIEI